MISFEIKYVVPEGEFCTINSRRATGGERVIKTKFSCLHVLRSYNPSPDIDNPIELKCGVFNVTLHHKPRVGVFKCLRCLEKGSSRN